MPYSHGPFLAFKIYIVPIDVPFLFGLDVLHDFVLCIDFEDISLKYNKQQWKIQINFQDKHGYIQHDKIPFTWYYNKQELFKLHRHLMRPSAGKIYSLLKRANPEKLTPKVQELQENIPQDCSSYSTFSVPTFQYRATIPPDDIILNREVENWSNVTK